MDIQDGSFRPQCGLYPVSPLSTAQVSAEAWSQTIIHSSCWHRQAPPTLLPAAEAPISQHFASAPAAERQRVPASILSHFGPLLTQAF